ncbi:hypothetical protein NDU88_005037 [Pleurodeles waltl]|uniref:Uncharacterized protein n=1 Tax=Pleurodeles waltl TaxID=8319 RepID=A0AAV7UGV6_PLEWA|nr:hypothetical protein NDU88_005037 [Pleurodeles waltl]
MSHLSSESHCQDFRQDLYVKVNHYAQAVSRRIGGRRPRFVDRCYEAFLHRVWQHLGIERIIEYGQEPQRMGQVQPFPPGFLSLGSFTLLLPSPLPQALTSGAGLQFRPVLCPLKVVECAQAARASAQIPTVSSRHLGGGDQALGTTAAAETGPPAPTPLPAGEPPESQLARRPQRPPPAHRAPKRTPPASIPVGP